MAISFTLSIINRLKKEIAEIQQRSIDEQKKKEKALSKINQLQRDIKISTSPSDLSSKMSRLSKLKDEINKINLLQVELSKQLVLKNTALKEQIAKDQQQENKN
ncbi:hypothetical protein [Paenibacillus sp. V4I7]|uniref:hypothetical protein n=1 Tax=Paenibacillus sp. V4I7 TaxID=3042307 RepID=UPI00278455A4|nr:hypothetical protein [Paenibacillus sp. V4I7]MDQ0896845.1 putative transcriptional regulator [Paenibacillus sp. V4I7]